MFPYVKRASGVEAMGAPKLRVRRQEMNSNMVMVVVGPSLLLDICIHLTLLTYPCKPSDSHIEAPWTPDSSLPPTTRQSIARPAFVGLGSDALKGDPLKEEI